MSQSTAREVFNLDFVRLRYFEDNSCGEVAKKLGTGLNAVYKRLSRLHQSLKDCIELRLDESKGG